MRGTIGGDRFDYPGEMSARTADMIVVKTLLNSVVSDNASVMTLDQKGTPLDTTKYNTYGQNKIFLFSGSFSIIVSRNCNLLRNCECLLNICRMNC